MGLPYLAQRMVEWNVQVSGVIPMHYHKAVGMFDPQRRYSEHRLTTGYRRWINPSEGSVIVLWLR